MRIFESYSWLWQFAQITQLILSITKYGHVTHHSKAANVGNPHLSNLQEISVDFGLSLSRWIGRWSGPLVEKFMKSPEIWICYSTSMGHSIAVSLIASRCVADKRQHKMWTTKKLFNHPCVRRSRCKLPDVSSHYLLSNLRSDVVIWKLRKQNGSALARRTCATSNCVMRRLMILVTHFTTRKTSTIPLIISFVVHSNFFDIFQPHSSRSQRVVNCHSPSLHLSSPPVIKNNTPTATIIRSCCQSPHFSISQDGFLLEYVHSQWSSKDGPWEIQIDFSVAVNVSNFPFWSADYVFLIWFGPELDFIYISTRCH